MLNATDEASSPQNGHLRIVTLLFSGFVSLVVREMFACTRTFDGHDKICNGAATHELVFPSTNQPKWPSVHAVLSTVLRVDSTAPPAQTATQRLFSCQVPHSDTPATGPSQESAS